MSVKGASGRHAAQPSPRSTGLRTHHLVALLLSSHPPLTLLWVLIPTVFGIGQVVATPLVFAFAGLILVGFVAGYSGLGRRIRHPGGLYVQVTSGLGRSAGLGAAGLLFLSYIGLVAAMYGLAAIVLSGLITAVFGIDIPIAAALVASVLLVVGLSVAPLRTIARIMIVVVGGQFLIVVWFMSSALNSSPAGNVSAEALDPGWLLSGSFIVALIFALTGFVGSEGATVYSGELVDPHKSIPRATYLSYGLTTAVVVLGSWAISGVVGAEDAVTLNSANLMSVLAHLMGTGSFSAIQNLLLAGVYVGVISTGATLNNGAARQLAGLARDGVLPSSFVADRAAGAPPARPALMVQPVASGVVALAATFSTLPALPLWLAVTSGLGVLAVLMLASAAAAVWFLRGEADERGFLGWEGQVVAGLFSVLTVGIVFGYGVTHIEQVAPGSPAAASWLGGTLIGGTFAAGVFVAQFFRVRRPAVYAVIGGARVNDERLVAPPVPSVAR